MFTDMFPTVEAETVVSTDMYYIREFHMRHIYHLELSIKDMISGWRVHFKL